jgi:hypothetical protein
MVRSAVLALRAVLWLAIGVEFAAGQTGAQVSGEIRDPSGAPVSGANVAIVHSGSGLRRTSTTGADGSYAVSSLPEGEYKITVRRQGFRTVARLGVMLAPGDAASLDFDLQIGGMQEFITVEGGFSAINTDDASSGIRIDDETARNLPVNGRTLQGLISFAPGVQATPATLGEAGQFSVNGQRPNANYFVTDGVSANSGVGAAGLPGQFSGGTLPAMTALGTLQGLAVVGELRELQVKTSTFAPEFGRMPGAQILVTTLAGSNNFHGEVSHAFRHERLSGRDFFATRGGYAEAPLRLNDLNASLGGPIQQNKTFFFASAEMLRLQQPSAWLASAPSALARDVAPPARRSLLDVFPVAQKDLSRLFGESTIQTSWPGKIAGGSFRIDRALTASSALFLRYHDSFSENQTGRLQFNDSEFRTRSFTAGVTHSPSSSMVNDVRLNVSRTTVESSWFPGLASQATYDAVRALFAVPPGTSAPTLYGFSVAGLGQVVWSGPNSSRQGQFQAVDTLAVTYRRHQIRVGLDYLRLTPSRREAIASAVAQFSSLENLLAMRDPLTSFGNAPAGSSLIEIVSAFAQDTWSVNERLNLTYGLRWEYMPPPASRVPKAALPPIATAPGGPTNPSGSTVSSGFDASASSAAPSFLPAFTTDPNWNAHLGRFAPRVGLAYRLKRSGDFVLRAGGGTFYDLGFASAIDPLNSVPFNSWRTTLSAPTSTVLPSGPSFGFAGDLSIPHSWQWNATLEGTIREVGVLSAGWVGSTGRRLLRREGYLYPGASAPTLVLATTNGRASYNAFQAHFRRRLTSGLAAIGSYTWSHSIDNGSWDAGSYLVDQSVNAGQERGSSNFDVRHSFSVGFTYQLPSRTLPRIARDWSFQGIARARSGFPIDVLARENAFGLDFDNAPRPDLAAGIPVWLNDPDTPGGRRLNPAAFLTNPGMRQGTLGRNALRGFSTGQFDAALERRFTLPHETALHLRVSVYNVLNTQAFADPVHVLTSPLFGTPISFASLMFGTGRPTSGLTPAFQSGGPRTAELSLAWMF